MRSRDRDWVERIQDLVEGGWTLPVAPAAPQPGGDD